MTNTTTGKHSGERASKPRHHAILVEDTEPSRFSEQMDCDTSNQNMAEKQTRVTIPPLLLVSAYVMFLNPAPGFCCLPRQPGDEVNGYIRTSPTQAVTWEKAM
ncbi:hypothetical protein C4D60_Mb04t29640 [Musa balbisiana]|uniref:Uncharacterized protein n=1 Tax=Musa balbisiana TaxID=52838 RepID=A0A4S8KFQ2_MUSBA|nr:hypothetical protein C4D60_Mb04t29640 [Musa balbisiana]